MQEKIDDYLSMGVEVVWVVDPWRRLAYQTEGRSLQQVQELNVRGTAIHVSTSQTFAGLNELEGRR